LLLPIGLFGFLEYYRQGHVDVRVAALLAVGFAVGVFAGGRWAQVEDLINEVSIRMNREPSEVHSQEDTQRRTGLAAPGAVGSVGGTLKRASTMIHERAEPLALAEPS